MTRAQLPNAISRRTLLVGAAATAGLWAAGCSSSGSSSRPEAGRTTTTPSTTATTTTTTTTARYWPADDWAATDPAAAGWDADEIEAMLAFAGERATKSLVLLLDGRILAERYFGVASDFRREIASCQKSVVSLLVGRAESQQLLSLDDPVTAHLDPGWSAADAGAEQQITIRHLLTMTSGLDPQLRAVAAPGEVWSYNNNAYHRLQSVLERVAGTPIDPLCREWLWSPIGVTTATWYERPGTGGTAIDPKGNRLWGLVMSARDMARFGLLVARDGSWVDGQVVDRAYVDLALASSSEENPSYGYLWWLNGQSGYRVGAAGSLQNGPLVPGAPPDTVAALGKDDQKIYVSRESGLVLVRQGERAGTRSLETISSFDDEVWTRLMAARPVSEEARGASRTTTSGA